MIIERRLSPNYSWALATHRQTANLETPRWQSHRGKSHERKMTGDAVVMFTITQAHRVLARVKQRCERLFSSFVLGFLSQSNTQLDFLCNKESSSRPSFTTSSYIIRWASLAFDFIHHRTQFLQHQKQVLQNWLSFTITGHKHTILWAPFL